MNLVHRQQSRMRIIAIAVFCMIALAGTSVAAFQATPDANEPASASPAASPEASPVASAEGSPASDATPDPDSRAYFFDDVYREFSEAGYGDRTVTSGQALLEYFLPIPPGVTPVEYSGLELDVSHSPLLLPELSTMTIFANGVAVDSMYLDKTNQDQTTIEIELPTDSFAGGGYLIQIRFSLRLSNDACPPADNQALWATIHESSTYYFSLNHFEGDANLSTLDQQFMHLTDPITIVLPENPTAAELDAAGKVAFQLGRWNGDSGTPPVVTYATVTDTPVPGPAIYVGTGSSLDDQRNWTGLAWNGNAFETASGGVPAEYGVIALLQDPNPILLVSGANDDALTKAANAIGERSAALNGPYAFVTGQEPPEPETPDAWSGNTTTFEQLQFDQREVRGDGTHTIDLAWKRPPEWVAGNGGNLTLSIENSPAIQPELSWVSVSVNGMEIGSASLGSPAQPNAYTFPLPAEAVNTARAGQSLGTLQVRIDMHLQLTTQACQVVDPANAWAVVLPDSSWSIPHNMYPGLDLARLPAPLTIPSSDAPFLIALPDTPAAADIDAGLNIASAFGQRIGTQQTGRPQLIRSGDITEEQKATTSIVVLGRSENNTIAESIESEEVLPAIVSNADPADVIQLGIVESPWFADGTVLSIIPGGVDGAASVTSFFRNGTMSSALGGTSAVVDPNLFPETTGLAEPGVPPADATPVAEDIAVDITPPPPTPTGESVEISTFPETAADTGDGNDDNDDGSGVEAWQVAASILLGGFVVAIGSFLWIRFSSNGRPDA